MDELEFEKFYNKALRYLSFRPRSEKEIRDYLSSKGRSAYGRKKIPQKTIEKIISKLKEQKFLDDEEFTKWWVEQRTICKPRSLKLIRMELRQKGISEEIIQKIFNFYPPTGGSIFNENELAKNLVQKRIKRYQGLPKKEAYQKLARFLAGKGFDWETIKNVVDKVYKNKV